MASTRIPRNQDELVSLSEDSADGIANIGAEVGLVHATEAGLRTCLADLMGDPEAEPPKKGSEEVYIAAKALKVSRHKVADDAALAGRDFIGYTKDVLYKALGRQWNSSWIPVGFTGSSLEIPTDPLSMLFKIRGFFTDIPEYENAPLNVTAAEAQALAQALSTARSQENLAKLDLGAAKAVRDVDEQTLYHYMTGLRSELDQLLGDDDPRWYAFGFPRPADGEGPGPISTLYLSLGAAGMVVADWTHAVRADRFRVFKQVAGIDPEPVQVVSDVEGLTFTLTGLPSGETVDIYIVPVNEAGDGPASPTVSAVVP